MAWLRPGVMIAGLTLFGYSAAAAQRTAQAAGRILTADSAPVAGARVTLHRVGKAEQGPLDSARADARGRFHFRFPLDSGSLYLVSARHDGIEYFSEPVHTNPARPDTALAIVVSDTSSQAPVDVEARHIVIARPAEDGTRAVLELLILRNRGTRTRVAPDSLAASWEMALPDGIIGFRTGDGDFSPDALERRGNNLALTAAIAPGEKQIVLQYSLPANARLWSARFDDAVETMDVLAEERSARVSGAPLAPADSEAIEGRTYRRWTGKVPAGSTVRVELADSRAMPQWVLAALVGLVASALAIAAWFVFRRTRAVPVRAAAPSFNVLVEEIAALDARYLGLQAETPAAEWTQYETKRADLKARVAGALADARSAD